MASDMNRRTFLSLLGTGGALSVAQLLSPGFPMGLSGNVATAQNSRRDTNLPNIILIMTDDQGYADVGCYGAEGFRTPHLDRMAAEGMRFTDFYVGSSVCSPSRAALMTGCYPQRVGLPAVLHPWSEIGLSSEETTIAEILKSKGYATACYGKWHLGHHPEFLPLRHGFDEYFGLPYSNDMWPKHPTKPNYFPDLPLIQGEEILEYNPDQSKLTTWYTERTIDFIEQNTDQPFFIYLAHTMPHVPLFVSDKFRGNSQQGLYGDVVMEIDWSVGQIFNTLQQHGLDENTLVIFISDNGPWLAYGTHAGSADPLREGKTTTFDGGQRVPCLMRWPGKIPSGTICREITTAMDILPTIAAVVDAELPPHRIDGKNIWPLMAGLSRVTSPHDAFYYYNVWKLEAVRSGKWKLHLPHRYFGFKEGSTNGYPGESEWKRIDLALFDLEQDPGETHDVAPDHPEVVKKLLLLAESMREDLGDAEKKVVPGKDFFEARTFYRVPGTGIREPGTL